MDSEYFSMRLIGKCPETIGELKELIKFIEDDISFGFRGMQALNLYEIKHGNSVYVVFQHTKHQENEQ